MKINKFNEYHTYLYQIPKDFTCLVLNKVMIVALGIFVKGLNWRGGSLASLRNHLKNRNLHLTNRIAVLMEREKVAGHLLIPTVNLPKIAVLDHPEKYQNQFLRLIDQLDSQLSKIQSNLLKAHFQLAADRAKKSKTKKYVTEGICQSIVYQAAKAVLKENKGLQTVAPRFCDGGDEETTAFFAFYAATYHQPAYKKYLTMNPILEAMTGVHATTVDSTEQEGVYTIGFKTEQSFHSIILHRHAKTFELLDPDIGLMVGKNKEYEDLLLKVTENAPLHLNRLTPSTNKGWKASGQLSCTLVQ